MQQNASYARLKKVTTEIEALVAQASPLLIKIGHLREEALAIMRELEQESENTPREVQET